MRHVAVQYGNSNSMGILFVVVQVGQGLEEIGLEARGTDEGAEGDILSSDKVLCFLGIWIL